MVVLFKILNIYPDFGGAATWVFHALTGKGTGLIAVSKKYNAALIVIFLWTMVGAVLSYSYAGALISVLTSPTLESPPNTWQDLLDRNYAIKSMTSSITGEIATATINQFEQAGNGSVHRRIFDRLNTNFGGGDAFRNFHRYICLLPY